VCTGEAEAPPTGTASVRENNMRSSHQSLTFSLASSTCRNSPGNLHIIIITTTTDKRPNLSFSEEKEEFSLSRSLSLSLLFTTLPVVPETHTHADPMSSGVCGCV